MGAMKEIYEDYKYAGDTVDTAPENFMDFLPAFEDEELKVGSLTLGAGGVMLRFTPTGGVLSMHEIATPIRPLTQSN
ncbi:hypothetical protein B9G69_012535 [Bdellovibrio sp. SKB1291214]|uniref:hypothetical protein n=1 Tax=Bdellovibrio sp. SKB1291214 TaxID=1732569 RepID=UPI000B51BA84|nr:hypothetical protein [Bdellovibrio sp. SKB1291214]UYL07873.1 hypothetical protein B9G69_012535 [Bdellovibrio sp. SKB1291214]